MHIIEAGQSGNPSRFPYQWAVGAAGAVNPGDDAPEGTPGTGEMPCPDCHGSGRIGEGACRTCAGSGKVIKGVGGA